ncbi:MAG: hypothetical protein NE334_00730 [Lentisphaeraceae bacterium]|nr:hypothetical protein [Lentisphaeraceae bacterium]
MATATVEAPKKRFPKRELNTWLRKNLSWNHEQWLELVSSLEADGFEEWTADQEGLDAIGLYLESKKANA